MSIEMNPERRLTGLDFILIRGAEIHPDRLAIDDRLTGLTLTYEQLRSRSAKLAHGFQSLGIKKGDRIAYANYNDHASVEIIFAGMMAGAVMVPLNTRLTQAEAQPFMDAQDCLIFIGHTDFSYMAEKSRVAHIILRGQGTSRTEGSTDYEELIASHPDTPLVPQVRWEDPWALGMTGGTTGGAKAVVWTHGGFLLDIPTVMVHQGLQRYDTTISFAPTYHIAGLGFVVLPILWLSGTVIFPPTPSFDPQFLHEELKNRSLDYIFFVPAMVEPLYAAWGGEPLTNLRAASLASAPTFEPQRLKLREMFPETRLITAYGMTETFSITSQSPEDFLTFADGVGEPQLGARVRIVNDEGRTLPRGEVGHIVARTVAMGIYHQDPDNTRKSFKKLADDPEGLDWIYTGDVGLMDDLGRVKIVDRSKDVIITGGENVNSVEVEAILSSHPLVKECAVVGRNDVKWGEAITAVIVKSDADKDDRELCRELLKLCRAKIAGYKIPKIIAFVDALPRSHFGKILKRDLRTADLPNFINSAELK